MATSSNAFVAAIVDIATAMNAAEANSGTDWLKAFRDKDAKSLLDADDPLVMQMSVNSRAESFFHELNRQERLAVIGEALRQLDGTAGSKRITYASFRNTRF